MQPTEPKNTPAQIERGLPPGVIAAGEQWAVFVDRVTRGTDPTDAARLAGYANPEASAIELVRLPHIRKALAAAVEGRLLSEAAPKALSVALAILDDEKAAPSIRGKMAIAILDRTKDKDATANPAQADLAALSQDQLEKLVAQLQQSGAIVVPLDVTPRSTRGGA